jgi:type VI secretion system protein ImpH
MDAETGKELPNIEKGTRSRRLISHILDLARLLEDGHLLNFFQAVYVLEKLLGVKNEENKPKEAVQPIPEVIYFRPDHRIIFPTSAISRIERLTKEEQSDKITRSKEIVRLTLTFLGLYGVSSPLPTYFSETIATQAQEDEPDSLRDFLDIFNHRLYLLLYRVWKKYRHYLHFQSDGADQLTSYMLSLLGSGIDAFSDFGYSEDSDRRDKKTNSLAIRLLTYAGLTRQFPHSAAGLRTLLHSFFDGIPVKIQEFVPRWVSLPEKALPQLGTKHEGIEPKLGETMIIGERVLDFNNKFRVILGPFSLEKFQSFLPDGCNAVILHRLVQLYAPNHLEFDVALLLKKDEVPPLKLGDKYARLGRISWLGKPKTEVVHCYT